MVTLALLIWLAVGYNMVAPWWLWTLWAVLWILNAVIETCKLLSIYREI